MPRAKTYALLHLSWQGMLADYGTAIAWTPDGDRLVACSAVGEVVLYDAKTGTPSVLKPAQGESIDALSISPDGQFLAAAGQAGTVRIWQIGGASPQVLSELTYPQVWIDRLQWHPHRPELAFSVGRHVQVWDALSQIVVTTLNFATSSVLDLAWHPHGEYLTVIRARPKALLAWLGIIREPLWQQQDGKESYWCGNSNFREKGLARYGAIAHTLFDYLSTIEAI